MLQRVALLTLLLGLTLVGGCATSNTENAGTEPEQAKSDNHPEKERHISSRTPTPVIGKPSRGPRQIDYNNPTQDDIRVLVERARAYYKSNGDYKALDDFMDPNSQFVAGPSYIFVYDYSGRCLAEWSNPSLVGTDVANGSDQTSRSFFQEAAAKAKNGGGWFTASARVPGSKDMRLKDCYVLNLQDKLFIGSGVYH